jgi:hypothetical protein
MAIQKKTEGRDLDEYLQEVWDSLEPAWDKSKFDMKQGYDSEYECDCIIITSKENEGIRAKIYVNDFEGRHPVGFDVVYRYPGDKGVGVGGSYEFQSTDMDGLGEEVFDYFDEIKKKAAGASLESDLQAYADAVTADKYDRQSVVDDGWDFENSVEYGDDIVRDNFKKKYDGKTYMLHITFNPSTKDVSDVKWGISAVESKKSEGLPPKKLGDRRYRSRADLINKMKILGATEITTRDQYDEIRSKQWLHKGGYAMDINGNLVGQTYYGDKDGKWYYASSKTFQGGYLPECNKSESKEDGERAVDDYDTLMDGLESLGFVPSSNVRNGMIYPYRTRFTATKDGVKYGFTLNEDSSGEYLESIEVIGGIFDKGDPNDPDATKFNSVGEVLDALKKVGGKKSEDGGKETSALLHLNTKGDSSELDAHDFLDDLYLNNRDSLGGFVRIHSKDLGATTGVYAASKNPEVLAEYLKLYAKEYSVRQDMHDGNWTEAVDVLPYILDCLQELVRKGGVPCKEQGNDTLVANGVAATIGNDGTIYVKDRTSNHTDGCDSTKDAAARFVDTWRKYNLNQGEAKKSESLTLKQKELKDMVRFGQAEDITTISDEEAKALRKKGIETIGVSRGTYGMNGALLRDKDGNKYVITARSSNLFYFV